MKFFTTALVAASAAMAAPAPSGGGCPAPPPSSDSRLPAALGTPSWAMTLASGTPLHYQKLSADHRSLVVSSEGYTQRATCVKGDNENHATLVVYNGELHLYSLGVRQQIYIENNDTGLRRVGFDTGYIPTGVTLDGWSVDEDHLLHNKNGNLVACVGDIREGQPFSGFVYMEPKNGGAYEMPRGNCYGFTPRLTAVADPVSCKYD